jgi:hypothetical protein
MDNFLENKTDKELVEIANSKLIGSPSGMQAQGALAELITRLTSEIKNLNNSTTKYSGILL